MTTKVTIEACCNDNTEVRVAISDDKDRVLQDGESTEVYAYDSRMIVVQEVLREQ